MPDNRASESPEDPNAAAPPGPSLPGPWASVGADVLAQLYRQVVERAGLAHALVTPDGTMLEASPAMAELLDRPAEGLVGTPLDELFTDLPAIDDGYDLASIAGLDELPCRVEHPDGSTTLVELALSALAGPDGEPVAFAAWARESEDDIHVASPLDFSSAMAELRHSSTHDPLTEVYNRSTIIERLCGLVAGTSGAFGAALLVDVDGFAALNDTLSHRHGDEVLRVVADRLALSLRKDADIGRSGADEFLVLVPGVEEPDEAETLARRLCRSIAGLHGESLLPHAITVSVGAVLCRPGTTPEELLLDAEVALQHARKLGPGRYRIFDDELREHTLRSDLMGHELKVAVDSERIATWYQPLVDLITGECVGWEALVRWILLDGTVRTAGEFIESAERSGTLTDLGQIVARDAVRRSTRAPAGTVVSINVTPPQIDSELLEAVEQLIDHYGSGPGRLAIEMDAPGLRSLDDAAGGKLERALRQGILLHVHNLTLDDEVLLVNSRFPVVAAKLDRRVTAELRGAQAPRALVDRITELAAALRNTGIRPVAEGVEDSDQAQVLQHAGWRYGQGYLFGPPAPATGGHMPRARNPLDVAVG